MAMFTGNPFTSVAPFEIYIMKRGRVLNYRLRFLSKSEGVTGTA